MMSVLVCNLELSLSFIYLGIVSVRLSQQKIYFCNEYQKQGNKSCQNLRHLLVTYVPPCP